MLNHYLLTNYYPKIIFVGMKEFSTHCPHATKEVDMMLQRVPEHYQEEGKWFEYDLQP